MPLRPLGHRILVTPDEQPEEANGIILPGDRDHVPVSGTVAAVGDGPARDTRIRTAAITRCIGIVDDLLELHRASQGLEDALVELGRYKNQVEQNAGSVRVGDRVVYPVEVGLKITEDGQDYILLNEDDVAVIATEEAA